ILKTADDALAKWPGDRVSLRIDALAPMLPDLQMEFVPEQFSPAGGRTGGITLIDYATHGAPAAAFVYSITGERKYARFAWEVLEQAARVNRWGWFPWDGAHMPQIHYGIASRNMV